MNPYIYLAMKKGRRHRFNKVLWRFEFTIEADPMWWVENPLGQPEWLPIAPTQELLNQLKGKLN